MAEFCYNLSFLPTSQEYLDEISTHYLVFIIIAVVLTGLILAIFLEELFFMHNNVKMRNWKLKDKALILLGIYPIFAVTSSVGLLIPRAAALGDLVCNLYLSGCLYVFLTMLLGHYGGKDEMLSHLHEEEINLQVPPCCCCCVCLPRYPVRKKYLVILEIMVLQYTFLKPTVQYISLVLLLDNRDYYSADSEQATVLSWMTSISTLLAMWANMVLFRMSAEPLNHISIKGKFRCIQVVLFATNFQRTILNFLAIIQLIGCEYPLDVTASVSRVQHLVIIIEMAVLSVLARAYYRIYPEDSTTSREDNPYVPERFRQHDVHNTSTNSDDSANGGSVVITTDPVSNRNSMDDRHLVGDPGPSLDVNDIKFDKQ